MASGSSKKCSRSTEVRVRVHVNVANCARNSGARNAEPAQVLDLQQQEHEHSGRDYERPDEHVHEPLQPQVRRHVLAVHLVVAARVQVRVAGGRRERAVHVLRPVALVHPAARERNDRLVRVARARQLERVVPPRGPQVVQLRVRLADPTACAVKKSQDYTVLYSSVLYCMCMYSSNANKRASVLFWW